MPSGFLQRQLGMWRLVIFGPPRRHYPHRASGCRMWVNVKSLVTVNGRPTDPKRRGDCAGRFPGRVHPLRQASFRCVQFLWPPDGLAACPAGIACCGAAFPAKLQFKSGKAREDAGHHPSGRVGPVDARAIASTSTLVRASHLRRRESGWRDSNPRPLRPEPSHQRACLNDLRWLRQISARQRVDGVGCRRLAIDPLRTHCGLWDGSLTKHAGRRVGKGVGRHLRAMTDSGRDAQV
jgi:hypothetical protein